MLNRILSVAAVAAVSVALVSGARAADLPTKAPMMAPAPMFSWTGFYVGGHFGAGWGTAESSLVFPAALPLVSANANGWLGGVQAGYNYQVGQWVLGVEGDFSWADIKSSAPCLVAFTCGGKAKWLADFTGRVGVTVDRALVYIKGGVAWANTDYNVSSPLIPGLAASVNDTRIGGLFGVGVEYAVSRNVSAKIEYNYIDYGTENQTFNLLLVPGGVTASVNQNLHTIKAGANYRF
jgi:outer membrane immunogenic protein